LAQELRLVDEKASTEEAVMAENKESCSWSEMEGSDDSVHNLIQFRQHLFRMWSFELASNGAERVNKMENNFILLVNGQLEREGVGESPRFFPTKPKR
jgi:hypothetical protein